MEEKEISRTAKRKTVGGKILRILFKTILILILVIATIALLILTPPVQQFIKNKATVWLSNKLQTKVAIGKIYIGFPKKIVLEDIYVEDKKKDIVRDVHRSPRLGVQMVDFSTLGFTIV